MWLKILDLTQLGPDKTFSGLLYLKRLKSNKKGELDLIKSKEEVK